MLTCSMLFENDTVARRQVGSGIGRFVGSGLGALGGAIGGYHLGNDLGGLLGAVPGIIIGGGLGGLSGNYLGSQVGKRVISRPNDPANFNKTFDRVGYYTDEDAQINPMDLISNSRMQRQIKALKKMGYDPIAIQSAVNPGYDKNGIPNATPFGLVLSKPQ